MKPHDLRILIVAEHASAHFGGEAFLPLHYFRVLRARRVEAWLLCHARVEEEVRSVFPEDAKRLRFIPDLWLHRLLWRLSRPLPSRVGSVSFGALSHLITQVLQRRIARRLVAEEGIDVVHEPIPVSPKQPSVMFDVGAPVVVGPMNGGMEFPPGFAQRQGRLERLTMWTARKLAGWMNRVIPGKRKAAVLLVANARTREALPKGIEGVPIVELVENGVDVSRFAPHEPRKGEPGQPVRFAFVGRLVDWKAIDILLESFARSDVGHGATLDLFGDGEERQRLESLAVRLGLGERVCFHGFVPQAEVATALGHMDVLVLPSLYECGGAVVLEAMAMGLPVIATRWGGPADYLDESCGILVDPVDRPSLIAALAAAMEELAHDPERRRQMGSSGRRKVIEHYDWERKVDVMLDVYAMAVRGWLAEGGRPAGKLDAWRGSR
jgi:glycosyltransferase involved in cell wall biosynthesis